jgi:hypothetical protein
VVSFLRSSLVEDEVYTRCLPMPTLMIFVEEPSPADALQHSDEDA